MEHVDSLISARWVLPVEPGGAVLADHAVVVNHGRIVAVMPEIQARARFTADEYIARPNHVLLPGLINAHTHAAMALLRGAAESASAEVWFKEQIGPREQRWMDAEYVRDGAELAIADMLTSGTTCFADMHLFPEIVAQAASAARMRACVGLPVSDAPGLWASSEDDYFIKGLELRDEYANDPLIATSLTPDSADSLSDEILLRVRRNADEIDLPVILRVNATRGATADGGERTLARLQRLGLLSPLLCAVHMVHATESDLDLAAAGGISIAHCPQSNLKLGNGVCPVPAIRGRGINLALGTAGAASNNDLSMLDEMRTAALLERGLAAGASTMSAHDWLQVATLNSAKALGMADVIGSIVPGKWADLCCIDLNRAHTQPVYDPAAQIVFAASRDQVSDVWVAGRALVTGGRLTRMDLDDIIERAARWQQRIASS